MSNIRILSGATKRDSRKGICDHLDCSEKLPSRRRTFCSDECGELFFMENNWVGIRYLVFLRDFGKCKKCGKNLVFNKNSYLISFEKLHHFDKLIISNNKLYKKYLTTDIYVHQGNKTTNWCTGNHISHNLSVEIDHIHPIFKGGDPLDIENMQTLCKSCHLEKTKSDRKKFVKTKIITNKSLEEWF